MFFGILYVFKNYYLSFQKQKSNKSLVCVFKMIFESRENTLLVSLTLCFLNFYFYLFSAFFITKKKKKKEPNYFSLFFLKNRFKLIILIKTNIRILHNKTVVHMPKSISRAFKV